MVCVGTRALIGPWSLYWVLSARMVFGESCNVCWYVLWGIFH